MKMISCLNNKCVSSVYKILIKQDNSDVLQFINDNTTKLSQNYSLSNKVYWLVNNLHDFPYCKNKNCINNHKQLIDPRYFGRYSYQSYCCNKCAQSDIVIKQKIKNTTFKRHGSATYRNVEKAKQTSLKKYGYENCMQSEHIKQKLKENNFKKYGCEWPLQSNSCKLKLKKKFLEKYGVENFFQLQSVKDKISQTLFQRYGIKHPINGGYIYNDITFDSAPELAFYIWLIDNNIKFEYQPNIQFEYFDENNKRHLYFPDFNIEGQLIEIKGNQFLNEDGTWKNPYDRNQDALIEAKHQCLLKNNVKIFYKEQYMKYIKYVQNKYGKKYLIQFKKR